LTVAFCCGDGIYLTAGLDDQGCIWVATTSLSPLQNLWGRLKFVWQAITFGGNVTRAKLTQDQAMKLTDNLLGSLNEQTKSAKS
jgi:hypothetical protein